VLYADQILYTSGVTTQIDPHPSSRTLAFTSVTPLPSAASRETIQPEPDPAHTTESRAMLVTTTPHIPGKEIVETFGMVSGEAILGANIFKDFFAGIRDIVGGRSAAYEKELRKAKEIAMQEMENEAAAMGGNAVISVDLDYESIQVSRSGSMLMVSATGTAVRYR
jgi:uncharacterized protein YbjQ (UPF0145 family)